MPITSALQVERVVKLSGCYLPNKFITRIDKYGSDPVAMRQAGINYAVEQTALMFQDGFNNVHIYTMNKPDVAGDIFSNLTSMLVNNEKNGLHK